MSFKVLTLEKREPFEIDISRLLEHREPPPLPVKLADLKTPLHAIPESQKDGGRPERRNVFELFELEETNHLPAKPAAFPDVPARRAPRKPFPVRIQDIELRDGRSIIVDGKKVEIPFGVQKRLTVGAVKKLAGSYSGSLMLEKKGNSSVRLRDDEIIELPGPGEKVEWKIVPSFKTE